MATEILSLNDVRRGDVALAGGKGANLGELLGQGFPVPPGFVVPARACEEFFQAIGLEEKYRGLSDLTPGELEERCKVIRNTILKAGMPQGLAEAILAAHGELAKQRGGRIVCAVRSSATAEDLGDASFAGQHDTYYYVEEDRILPMVKHCWASLWSPEAVSYRSTQGIDHGSVFMAVVVQEMIMSEISGVTFTANPVTGSRDEIVTESSWGMGAAIVDGRVTPDHYVMKRSDFSILEKRIAEKRFMVPARLEQGEKARLREVPLDMRKKETLAPELAQKAAEWSVRAEDHFGSPQDLEWAISNGEFFMLQSRPITIMGREDIGADVEGRYVIFKSIVENFTEPLTPLTGGLMSMAFSPPLIRLIRGWLYISLKHSRALLPFKISYEKLADLLYLSHGAQPPRMKVSLIKLPFFLGGLILHYFFLGVLYVRVKDMPDDFMDGFRRLAEEVDADPDSGPLETAQRLFTWQNIFEPLGNMVLVLNIVAQRYWLIAGVMKKLLRRWVPDAPEDAEALLCSGTKGVLSTEMGREIWDLAKEAKRCGPVRELLAKHKPENILAELKAEPEAKDFLDQLECFLARHGHRALKELELRSVRWEENPAPVLGMIRNYLLVESDPTAHEKKMDQARADLKASIRKKLDKYPFEQTFKFRWRLLDFLAEQAKYFAKMRENSRFYHIMAFYIVRKKILGLETEFLEKGKLKCKDDIFFLSWDELIKMQSGDLDWVGVEEKIRARRMEHIRLSKMVPPKTIGVKPPEEPLDDEDGDKEAFQGQSASPGKYKGVAHVILDPSVDIELKPGEILVAPYTDPAWTPLFLTAGAAVVEVGSYLSHAGTVAREF
ncbi:MAG: PEP/pyruvate-binding domain-containing protein, partial [Thermodesulfobacteriota bacterium]|nr:PEP/pyruvate-binding domain-containing protein [Thermodesulfobacteriota bacterium]